MSCGKRQTIKHTLKVKNLIGFKKIEEIHNFLWKK